jgi:hypothetical protein
MWQNDCRGKVLKCVGYKKVIKKMKIVDFTPKPTNIAPHIFNTGTCRVGGSASSSDHLSQKMGPGKFE